MNKLFTLYNNLNLISAYKQNMEINKNNLYGMAEIFSKKIILNTYKLLRKSYIKLQTENNSVHISKNVPILNQNNKSKNIANTLKAKNINKLNVLNTIYMENNTSALTLKSNKALKGKIKKNSKSYITIKKTVQGVILLNKLNRIDRFFNKYKNLFLDSNNNTLCLATLPSKDDNNIETIEISNSRFNNIKVLPQSKELSNLNTVPLNLKVIENSNRISHRLVVY